MNWLSYGGGVNSTALAILLCEGKLPQYEPFGFIFADTKAEKDETYAYIEKQFVPYLARHEKSLTIVVGEPVLDRWARYGVIGHRINRSCTEYAKIIPIKKYIEDIPGEHIQLIGIDAGESHRATNRSSHRWNCNRVYPLIDLGIDRNRCVEIIRGAGLCIPEKSGCWCCPFARVSDILSLAKNHPERMNVLAEMEKNTWKKFNKEVYLWGERPIGAWQKRGEIENTQGDMDLFSGEPPCGCYDG
jgi:3'-phosphoadenosine 5'-phosphosulfate sulfotransferase (PAPS reductase)/FAD synthetase